MTGSETVARGRLVIEGRRVVTPAGVLDGSSVLVEGGRIAAVNLSNIAGLPSPTATLSGAILMPGFIDLHAHGFAGHGFGDAASAREASRLVAHTGVTSWYAGLGHGATFEAILSNVEGAAPVVGRETGGARLAGIYMEGPYISVEKKGAWVPAHLRPPSIDELRRLKDVAGGALRRVNVAPELRGGLEFIRAARQMGLAVSIGHSNATYEEALAAVDAGATIANHTYNAMSALDHRNPGVVGAALTCEGLLAELILDGVHVHHAAARALFRAKGAVGVALITDASQLAGMPDGDYEYTDRTVRVKDGACRLPDGTLAGSVSGFDAGLRHAHQWLSADLLQLAAMTSGNAARAMGIDGERGAIRPGLAADLVLLDEGLQVIATIVGGEVVYHRAVQ